MPPRAWTDPGEAPHGHRRRAGVALTTLAVVASVVAAMLIAGPRQGALGAGGAPAALSEGSLQVTNLPPLLTTPDDPPTTLRYDVTCAAPDTNPDAGCDVAGTVFVRAGQSGPFRAIPLVLDPNAAVGRYAASLPGTLAGSSFSYYAVVHDNRTGQSVTLPAGGAAAPQRSILMPRPVTVSLGAHAFGVTSRASARVASAPWGDGPTQAGLEDGPQLEPIGGSSFDVDAAGNVTVLDEAHRRLLRFAAGKPTAPTSLPVDVRGTIADLRSRADGGADVLESAADPGQTPVMHSFDVNGRTTGTWHAAQNVASALRVGPAGPEALEYPSAQWMPIGAAAGARASLTNQIRRALTGRAQNAGGQIVAEREGAEARIALVDAHGGVQVGWRIRSTTPLAEIQLAEPFGNRVLVVLRTYTDAQDEFVALVLGSRGLEQQRSIAPDEWAETAPLSRFRMVGSSLYHLGSTPAGMFVDRYDLEVQ
ncbi:MAG TPA: hypothetical protein VEH79_02255 [Gaiellaceae bacterium]|nr:hypothetical protein [Gaiellaceae bacterium]